MMNDFIFFRQSYHETSMEGGDLIHVLRFEWVRRSPWIEFPEHTGDRVEHGDHHNGVQRRDLVLSLHV